MSLKREQVLLLNATEVPIKFITWKRAASLIIRNKAHKPHNFEDFYSISYNGGEFKIPTVIVLSEYKHIPTRKNISPTRKNILKRDKYVCQYCSKLLNSLNASVDHIIPSSKGGTHEWTNVVASCKQCNAKKANKHLYETNFRLIRKPEVPKATDLNLLNNGKDIRKSWERWI
jgi:5-methylcytosine-specific restriction endonuclease McrA